MKSVARKAPSGHGVIALGGYGVRIVVERGHLVIEDGMAGRRRLLRLSRVAPEVQRIVVTGHAGSVTLDALRWMCDTGIAFIQLDSDGQLLTTNVSRALDDVRVRRGQALASLVPQGVEIARTLLTAKLEGQCAVLRDMGGKREAVQVIHDAKEQLSEAETIDELRYVESRAAAEYWDAWQGIPVRFASRDVPKVPAHWRAFDARRSQLSSSPRKASTPINALLNYLYGVLEAEARIAAQRVGCDPAMGLVHADRPNRANFATDLMEPVRPSVDAYVLRLLEQRTFLKTDFFENRDGNCRLLPPLTSALAETAPQWAKALAPVAEHAASAFAHIQLPVGNSTSPTTRAPFRLRTPLTQRNRMRPTHSDEAPTHTLANRCKDCGRSLRTSKRTYCDACLPEHVKRAAAKGTETQRQLRAIGADRRQSLEVRATHRQHALDTHHRNTAWEALQPSLPNPTTFDKELLPRLLKVTAVAIREATGLSLSAAKTIKNGRMRPHPRHWEALRQLADAFGGTEPPAWTTLPLDYFATEIAPRLLELGAEAITASTGLSASYARRVRFGHHVPHRKHWPCLRRLLDGSQ